MISLGYRDILDLLAARLVEMRCGARVELRRSEVRDINPVLDVVRRSASQWEVGNN